jgi:flotillin
LPDVVKALASPLANVDKITIVSTGDGDAAGMTKITGDLTKMAAQVPALFETLSGMPLGELLGKVRQIDDRTAKPGADKGNSKEAHTENADHDAADREKISSADEHK